MKRSCSLLLLCRAGAKVALVEFFLKLSVFGYVRLILYGMENWNDSGSDF